MTVQTEISRSGPYAGAGTTGPFTVGFRFLDNTHLQVIRTSTSGIDATLVITTDYTVSGAGGASGTVTLVSALATGERLTIIRDVPFTQLADYVDNDAFPAESHENALDLLTMQTQQNQEELARALTLPATTSGVSTELPFPEANKFIGWNETGTALQNLDTGTLATIVAYGTANSDVFDGDGVTTQFVLSDNPGALNNLDVAVEGVTQTPGIDYTWSSGTTVTFTTPPVAGTDNVLVRYMQALSLGTGVASDIQYTPAGTGAVATTVQAKLRESVSVLDFAGLAVDVGGPSENWGPAFQAAVTYAASIGGKVLVPGGSYFCGDVIFPSNSFIYGEADSEVKRTSNYGWQMVSGADNITIESINFNNNAPGTAGTHKRSLCVLNVTVTNLTVRNCKFYNGYDIAVKNAGPDGIYISNVGIGAPSATRNNFLIENCSFDGFTRNGISITNGANGVLIRNCLFTNNGLCGIDVESDYGTSTYIYDMTIDKCRFIDNGAGSLRGTDVRGGALTIFSQSPATFHSDGVKVTDCYFATPTAVNTLGIYYFLVASTKNFHMSGCNFDVPVSPSAHYITFESSTYGSQYGLIENNIFKAPVECYTFAFVQFNNNQFLGALSSFTSAALGIRKTLSNNLFYQSGSGAKSPITIGSIGTNIINNRFYDDRASLVPTDIIKYAPANTTSLVAIDWTIADNTVASITSNYGNFFSLTGGSSNYGVQNIRFRGNDISNCGQGLQFASSASVAPNCFDVDVTDNTFNSLSSIAINMNGVGRFTCNGNIIKDCATNTIALNITRSDGYVCSNNRVSDTRTLTARSTYAISAQNTQAGTPTSLLSSNLSRNTQSGFTIAAGEGTSVNNTAY